MEKSFISFGCWNRGFCNSSDLTSASNDFSRVVSTLARYISISPSHPEFICILGDNYYPDVFIPADGKKIKTASYTDLKSGFDCIETLFHTPLPIEIDLLVGNHDIENTTKMRLENFPRTESSCKITESQVSLVSGLHQRIMSKVNGINLVLFNYRIVENTIVVMIDSNIYFEDLEKSCHCYIPLMNAMGIRHSKDARITVEWIKATQAAWLGSVYQHIDELCRDPKNKIKFKNIIIMAHHPLCCLKRKNGRDRFDCPLSSEYPLFCREIYLILNRITGAKNFYYNSADLHTYQAGTITLSVQNVTSSERERMSSSIQVYQHIAGTGGALLEPEVSETNDAVKNIDGIHIVYHVTESAHTNGFLVWTVGSRYSKLNVAFIRSDIGHEFRSFSKSSMLPVHKLHDIGGGMGKVTVTVKRQRQRCIKRLNKSRKMKTKSKYKIKCRHRK